MKYLVVVDEGYEIKPLDFCDHLWQAERRVEGYKLGWKMTGYGEKVKILKIEVIK